MNSNRWTINQLKLAFHLYCRLSFGQLHQGNPEVVELAGLIGRTPSALAMKLCNFASLDPAIVASGRKGLAGASRLDRQIWELFRADWEGLAMECAYLRQALRAERGLPSEEADEAAELPEDFTGATRQVLVEQRIKQQFFRRAVLGSYVGRCCMSGLSEPCLLIASHIVPWRQDPANRLNPANGLCLSALHDRAFDQGLLSLDDEYRILLAEPLRRAADPFVRQVLQPLAGRPIALPERFLPEARFVAWHRQHVFVDSGGSGPLAARPSTGDCM
ncbi:HNH endonuclease [Azotobacter salinestris]|uniref:HNH endonuclease n=1 Tax=Azotobacter salinestris TaxID=69964 RepID=UPI0032E01929